MQLKFATLDRCKLQTQSVQLVKAANSGKNDGSQNELKNTCQRKTSTESLTLANKVNLKRFTNYRCYRNALETLRMLSRPYEQLAASKRISNAGYLHTLPMA